MWFAQKVPDECKRRAAERPGAWQNYVFTPHADDLAMFNPDRAAQVRCAPPHTMYSQTCPLLLHTLLPSEVCIQQRLPFKGGGELHGAGMDPSPTWRLSCSRFLFKRFVLRYTWQIILESLY